MSALCFQVLVFVMDTLKPSIFQRLLLQRPVAVEHYINYLRLRSQHDRLDNILAMLGRFEEAAVSHGDICLLVCGSQRSDAN